MDLKQRETLQQALKSLPVDNTQKLILQSQPPPQPRSVEPSPGRFRTRQEFRKALIDHQSTSDSTRIDALANRLRGLGLEVRVVGSSGTVIVEGRPPLLAQALEDAEIESADLDRQIELIKPTGRAGDDNR